MVYDKSKQYDVVIIGAGPSGISAAIAAARNGAQTLLIEKYGTVGGMSTSGNINIWCGEASSGIYSEIAAKTTICHTDSNNMVYNPEVLKYVYLQLLEQSGVDLLLHSQLTGVQLSEDGTIQSVELLANGVPFTVDGSIFIDSTGNGDLAYHSAIPFHIGRETDGLMQPLSVMLMVGGVDDSRVFATSFGRTPELQEKMKQWVAEGHVAEPAGHVIIIPGYEKGTAGINMTNIAHVDATDPIQLTKAECHTRLQIPGIIEFLRKYVPGMESCYLISSGFHVGVREARHFHGQFTLDEQHIQQNKVFSDWIVSGANHLFNNHNLTGSGSDKSSGLQYNWSGYTIPYGCVVTDKVQNLLLNGRCISVTHMAHASMRVMPICIALGQGVGTAAAVAVKNRTQLKQVDIKQVQRMLIEQGVAAPQADL